MSIAAAMTPLIASLHGPGFGIESGQASEAADGAALVMLGVIFFVIGLLGLFAWTMRRRSRRPDPTLEFLSTLPKESVPSESPESAAAPRESWERPADWWKQP